MLTDQYLEGDYLRKVPDWHAGDSPWKAMKVLDMLNRHGISPRSLCDVGCGAGEILIELRKKLAADVRLVGYDISPQAIDICKSKEGGNLRFEQCDFVKSSSEAYDVALLLDVFEHVPDYLGFLEALRGRAHWFVFHVPLDISVEVVARRSNHMMYMRKRYGHLHYFTKETALATLADAGYTVVDYFFTADAEISGMSKMPQGYKARLWHLFRYARFLLERVTFRLSPATAARIFKGCNLMVLARGRAP